jgi:hypothetical protein
MNGFKKIQVIGDERMNQLGKQDKVPVNILPDILREFVVNGDHYTVDDDGHVYNPYYEKYPDIEAIVEQYELNKE